MKSRSKTTDWPVRNQSSTKSSELEKELTKALDKASSTLADRLDDIAQRHKRDALTEHIA